MSFSKWILSCASLGIVAIAASHAGAAPKDPEERSNRREARVEAIDRSILRLPMVDDFRSGRDAFLPRGQEIAREKREARHSRRAARRSVEGDVDLAAIVQPGGSASAPSVSPIPEPSSLILLAAGAGLVAFAARRKLV